MNPLVNLLTGNFPHATEIVCIFMAIQGSMKIRQGPNRNNSMHWFHAFLRSMTAGYAGACFTNLFMGRPTAMFSNDIFFGSCLIGYLIVNWTPLDFGYHMCNTFIGEFLTTVFAQVFRVGGVCTFSSVAYNAFKDNPSKYYPTPVFGPILFPSMLGNMGGFFGNGVDKYLEKGLPWMIQQSISCSVFYHFYTHDAEGYLGVTLRSIMKPIAIQIMLLMGADEKESEDDALFAKFVVGVFMVGMGVLRMPQILGPTFSPFMTFCDTVLGFMSGKKKKVSNKPPSNKKKNSKKNQ